MAVANIDTVYQRVLALANKEQRGYITPQEFNLLAGKAQNDIFEMYFHDYKMSLLRPGNQSKTADDIDMLREKIAMHRVVGGAVGGYLPSDAHWLESVYRSVASNTNRVVKFTGLGDWGDVVETDAIASMTYIRLKAYYDGTGDAGIGESHFDIYITNTTGDDIPEGIGNNIVVSVDTGTETADEMTEKIAKAINDHSPYHSATNDGADLTVTYKQFRTWSSSLEYIYQFPTSINAVLQSTTNGSQVVYEEVDRDNWIYIQSNKKLNPTTNSRGIFHRVGSYGISILPDPGGDTILCDYIKRPADPKWGYVVVGDKALYDSTNTIPFELHASEESTLTNKILELAGIVINKPGLSEVILRNEAVKEANENK